VRGATWARRPASQDLLDEDTALVGAPLECSAQDPGLQHYYLVLISEDLPATAAAEEAMPFTPAQVSGFESHSMAFQPCGLRPYGGIPGAFAVMGLARPAAPNTYVIDDIARGRDLPLDAHKRRRKSRSRHCNWDLCWDGEAMADATAAHTKGSQSLSRCVAPAISARHGMLCAKTRLCFVMLTSCTTVAIRNLDCLWGVDL